MGGSTGTVSGEDETVPLLLLPTAYANEALR